MQKISWLTLISAGLLSIFAAATTFAGSRAGALTFTAGGGYEFFSPKRDIKNSGVPLAALGYDFTDRWAIEALLGMFNTNSKNSEDTRQVSSTLFAVDGIYHFSNGHSFEPYLLAGPGISSFDPNGTNAHTQGNINAGAGLQYFIDKVVAVRFEVRDFYTINSPRNDVMLDAGLTFLLDLC